MTEQATTATPPPAKDWREFVEWADAFGNIVHSAIEIRGKWYGLVENSMGQIFANHHENLIFKPKPKTTRPWTPDEVPVGAVVKNKATGVKSVILCSSDKRADIAGMGWLEFQYLHNNYLLELTRPSGSTPGSYGVCGVEE